MIQDKPDGESNTVLLFFQKSPINCNLFDWYKVITWLQTLHLKISSGVSVLYLKGHCEGVETPVTHE